ncbi:leukemia inhibitory factor receptor-like isoform X1 [Gadus chalcogrammus]|uniref:leukemia inhibitory factor receptor-like isoform X1 n=1 Tax=Gadus chalcogrammus TaxID=1042646 RepID=UPI0024C4CF61|nr:leukemia inhibitory factor receptor-like isoform X1 [Gadus chalcogrammus]
MLIIAMTMAVVSPWLLTSLLLHIGGADTVQDAGVMRCGPLNMTVSRVYSKQKVQLTWEDHPSCLLTRGQIAYEIDVLSTDDMKTIHHDVVIVPQNQTGSIHHWLWVSPLPLECANNTFKVRAQYEDQRCIIGIPFPSQPTLFPPDTHEVYEVGSNVTFCCLLPPLKTFHGFTLHGKPKEHVKLNNQTYAMTVHLRRPSGFGGTDVTCNNSDYGTTYYVGYRPRDTDLQCETRDLQSVVCNWSPDKSRHWPPTKYPTEYELLGRSCSKTGKVTTMKRCRQREVIKAQERNWTLTVRNVLGTLELTDRADLTKRVHMFAPQNLTASRINARNASLAWEWSDLQYRKLRVLCQIILNSKGDTDVRNYSGLGLNQALLSDLTPNLKYEVQVCCGTEEHFWKWGDRKNITFKTEGDIPDALDIWLWMEQKQTMILWEMPQPGQSHGPIIDYEVKWRTLAEPQETRNRTVLPPDHSTAVELDPSEDHLVTVTARNPYGRSPPASMVTLSQKADEVTNVSRIVGSDGGFSLTWSANPVSSCGYAVVWTPTFTRGPVYWKKVPTGVTQVFITGNLTPGVRYSLCVYACTPEAPKLLERREGYVEETEIPPEQIARLRWAHVGSEVRVSWTPIPLGNRTAFIKGYVMHYHDMDAKEADPNLVDVNVTTDDAEATSLTARDVRVGSYRFRVAAVTSLGEGGGNSITLTINPPWDKSILALVVAFSNIFLLLIITSIIAFKNWTCIKQKVCPPIPNPVLICDWLALMEDRGPSSLIAAESHSSQMENVSVSQVFSHRLPVSTDNDHEGAPFLQNQAANGYYHQQPQQRMEITPKVELTQPVLPSRPLSCVFENPLYTDGMC